MAKKSKPKAYRVLQLITEGVKRIKVVELTPDRNVNEITGDNDQGKSSLLDSLEWALRSKKAADQPAPINRDAEEARTVVVLGDDGPELIATRTFKRRADGSIENNLKLEASDGGRFDKAQSVLDAIVGRIGVDPLRFIDMEPKDQFAIMREFVPDVDFDAMDRLDKRDYDTRTDRNREQDIFAKQAQGITIPEDWEKLQPVDESDLIADLESVGQRNADIDRIAAERATSAHNRNEALLMASLRRDEIGQLRAKIAVLESQERGYEELATTIAEKLAAAPALPEKGSVAEISAELDAARRTNSRIEKIKADFARRDELVAKAKAAGEASKVLTEAMAKRAEERKTAIEAAKMPIDGIDLSNGIVLLDGLPFSQAAMSKKVRASVAIAAALNPELKVMFVRDGDKLSGASFDMLCAIAKEYDVQLWLETVESDRPNAIVIEDGRIAS